MRGLNVVPLMWIVRRVSPRPERLHCEARAAPGRIKTIRRSRKHCSLGAEGGARPIRRQLPGRQQLIEWSCIKTLASKVRMITKNLQPPFGSSPSGARTERKFDNCVCAA